MSSSLDDWNNARQRGETVGHLWKSASDNRANLPASDPFKEAVRLSSDSPEPFLPPFPRDPNAPVPSTPTARQRIYPVDGHRHFFWESGLEVPLLDLATFGKEGVDEWNRYLSLGAGGL